MKYGGPVHPLDVLFIKPPLDNIFEYNKGMTKNKVVTEKFHCRGVKGL